jgi:hypothetical protein
MRNDVIPSHPQLPPSSTLRLFSPPCLVTSCRGTTNGTTAKAINGASEENGVGVNGEKSDGTNCTSSKAYRYGKQVRSRRR